MSNVTAIMVRDELTPLVPFRTLAEWRGGA
jgi:hypothetical protein